MPLLRRGNAGDKGGVWYRRVFFRSLVSLEAQGAFQTVRVYRSICNRPTACALNARHASISPSITRSPT